MEDLSAQKRILRCTRCREIGHYANKCPHPEPEPPLELEWIDDPENFDDLGAAARTAMRIDALGVEIRDYKGMIAMLQERVTADEVERELLTRKLSELRRSR